MFKAKFFITCLKYMLIYFVSNENNYSCFFFLFSIIFHSRLLQECVCTWVENIFTGDCVYAVLFFRSVSVCVKQLMLDMQCIHCTSTYIIYMRVFCTDIWWTDTDLYYNRSTTNKPRSAWYKCISVSTGSGPGV